MTAFLRNLHFIASYDDGELGFSEYTIITCQNLELCIFLNLDA